MGQNVITELIALEQYLLDSGALTDQTIGSYRSMLNDHYADSVPLPNFGGYCTRNPECDRLEYPSVVAAFVTCNGRGHEIARLPRLGPTNARVRVGQVARDAEQTGDVGSPYALGLLDAMDENLFAQDLYRAAVLQTVAMEMFRQRPKENR